MPQASSYDTEYIVVNNVALSASQALEPLHMPRTLRRAAGVIIVGSLIVLPLAFGAVHPPVYLTAHIVIYALLLAFLVLARPCLKALLQPANFSTKLIGIFSAFALYSTLQIIVLANMKRPHPILGLTSAWANPQAALRSLDAVFFFLATFIIVRVWLGASERRARFLVWTLISVSLFVSLVALSHWFYDNGRLFWTFEPKNTFISSRARWPFVNPNNLAHFLLPAFFLMAAKLSALFSASRQMIQGSGQRKFVRQISSNLHLQSKILQSIFTACAILCTLLCIAGSLSRSAWLGLSLGIAAYGWKLFKPQSAQAGSPGGKTLPALQAEPETEFTAQPASANLHEAVIESGSLQQHVKPAGRRPRHRPKSETFSGLNWNLPGKAVRLLLFALAVGLLYFFLQGRGSELIEGRIEYGLTCAKDDMRWQLYADTLAMIKDHWVMGVGLGSWASYYPKYKNRLLSGMNPVFLHSEPLQLFAETGLVGALLLICGVILIIHHLNRVFPKLSAPERTLAEGTGIGLLSLGLASALEFPFRIPAIVFYSAVYLALMGAALDKSQNRVSTQDGR